MLKSIALERTTPSAPPRERDLDAGADPAFAGMLAGLTASPSPAALPSPAPSPAPDAAPREGEGLAPASPRVEVEGEQAPPARAAEAAEPKAQAPAKDAEGMEQEAPPEAQAPEQGNPEAAQAAPEHPASPAGLQAPLPPSQPLAKSGSSRVSPEGASRAGSSAMPRSTEARQHLEAALPGLRLEEAEAAAPSTAPASGKALLDEMMARPAPSMELPRPLADQAAAASAAPTPGETSTGVQETHPLLQGQAHPLLEVTPGHGATAPITGAPQAFAFAASGTTSARAEAVQAGLASPATRSTVPAMTQLEGSVRWLLKNQGQAAELQLHPENLGRVVISLKVEDGDVHARVWASEASTLPLLQEQRSALELSLREQGLNLGSFDLQQGRQGHEAREAPFQTPTKLPRNGPEPRQETPRSLAASPSKARRLEVYA